MISYQIENDLSLAEFIEVLNDSGLGKRRPMDDHNHLQRMIMGSNFIISARKDGKLIGVMRGLSDHCYRCFIADLAVMKAYQGQGIGRKILQFARDQEPEARLFLFAAEDAESFYQRLGFQIHERCYQLKPGQSIS
jgi:GNAT superfamily N-acetyltransferase